MDAQGFGLPQFQAVIKEKPRPRGDGTPWGAVPEDGDEQSMCMAKRIAWDVEGRGWGKPQRCLPEGSDT